MKQNFVSTADKETAEKLRALNFQEVQSSNNNIYTFLNCNKLNFSECDDIDKNKIQYTNMLCM